MSQPRDDYQELLLLCLVFLDSFHEKSFSFKRPGAMHHARWMSKAIYSLKIFLFRDQFKLSAQEKKILRRICIFVILFYIKVWYNSTSAIQAPNNDLEFMKNLIQSKNIDPPVLQRACQKMIEHLWYLNEELATISLFDNNVSVDVKKKIVAAIQNRESSTPMRQRYEITEQNLESLLQKDLSDFISKNSLELFKKFDLPCDFLEDDVLTWCNNDSYKECLEYLNTLKVTNDVAERGVALIEEYNNYLTKDEKQLQYLLQVVREHRQRYPNYNKTTLQQDQFYVNV